MYINLEVENRIKPCVIPNKNGPAIPIKMLQTEKFNFFKLVRFFLLRIFLIIDFLKPVEYFLSGMGGGVHRPLLDPFQIYFLSNS